MTGATGSRGGSTSAAPTAPMWAGWSGVALGVLAWWLTLPPLLVRTPAPSIVLAAGGGRARAVDGARGRSGGSAGARSSPA